MYKELIKLCTYDKIFWPFKLIWHEFEKDGSRNPCVSRWNYLSRYHSWEYGWQSAYHPFSLEVSCLGPTSSKSLPRIAFWYSQKLDFSSFRLSPQCKSFLLIKTCARTFSQDLIFSHLSNQPWGVHSCEVFIIGSELEIDTNIGKPVYIHT